MTSCGNAGGKSSLAISDSGFDNKRDMLSSFRDKEREGRSHNKVNDKYRVASLFTGIGAWEKAMKNLNIDYDLVHFAEIDKWAETSYCAIFDEDKEKNIGDITKVNPKDMNDFDLLFYSPPCFTEGHLVMTSNGYKEIQNIELGDYVLTHNNQFKKVINTMASESNDIFSIKCQGVAEPIICTSNHPFYARKKEMIWNNEKRRYERVFGEADWIDAGSLSKDYYVGLAINNENKLPKWEGVSIDKHGNIQNTLVEKFKNKRFWYIVGRWLGDGWLRIKKNPKGEKSKYETIICCSHDELYELKKEIGDVFNYSVVKERTTYKIFFYNKELTMYLSQFGRMSYNKHLTGDVFNLPKELVTEVLRGIMDSDGSFYYNGSSRNRMNKITSTSKELLYGVGQLVMKLGYTYSIIYTKRPDKCTIEGREVNQRDTYAISFSRPTVYGFFENNMLWMPVKNVTKLNNHEYIDVYNFEVENDNSYTVNNITVHNCQSFSMAGKQLGFDDERGILFFDALRIIKEKKPKYALMKNVKGLTGKKFHNEFQTMLKKLEETGYNNYWQILNAKDYGIPQNRERVFVVSIRKDVDDYTFEFPEPFDSGLRLKHLLLNNVDKKYYIKDEKVTNLLSELREKDFLKMSTRNNNKIISVNNPKYSTQSVFLIDGIAPTLRAGNEHCKIVCAERGRYLPSGRIKQQLEIRKDFNTNAITTVQKDNLVIEPAILRAERTEYGKSIRKEYEAGKIKVKRRDIRTFQPRKDGLSNTLTTVQHDNLLLEPKSQRKSGSHLSPNELIFIGGIGSKDWAGDGKTLSRNFPQGNRVYSSNGIACSQTSQGGGIGSYTGLYLEDYIQLIEIKCTCGLLYISDNLARRCPFCSNKKEEETNRLQLHTRLSGGIWDRAQDNVKRVYKESGIAPTISTCQGGHTEPKVAQVSNEIRIRKLTPQECWRLMGFTDEDYFKARKTLEKTYYNGRDRSNSQMYKQAGNSIVVNVVEEILKKLLE